MEFGIKYDPKGIEEKIYKKWEQKGYFKPTMDKTEEPFTIVMPPPNITGKLHMGHALDNTIQDIFIRYNRMTKRPTLWLPGTDHASIATELKIVEQLKQQGITKLNITREEFLNKAWEWKKAYGDEIINQLKELGCSCDWSRERFTMDDGLNKAVETVFVNLYNKGLIYKGERIVNWCLSCKTSISDAEVEYEEEKSSLWYIKYMIEGSTTNHIVVATTRPETMLGDTAIAVNPKDERYKEMVGKNVILPILNRPIPIIADEYVEKEFGTGAVKITPAHDPNDFEIGKRHFLESIVVIDEDGKITKDYGKYSGLDIKAARELIVEDLKQTKALIKTEEYVHNVGRCYRCKTNVEPYVSQQWFVKMKELAEPAIEAVKNGECKFIPERFEKIYFNWMENIRDWCISRQLWWGHRIPAYYCTNCLKTIVTTEKPEKCECGGQLKQDEDILDTWFSSALWPFSTLGWPENTEDFEYFYPTSMLVTGYDIITFWVSKMIFSAIEHTKKIPFKEIYIHGLVRDSSGRKMSKSLGNGIDPLEVMNKYGTDALRFSLIQNISLGNDIRYVPEKVEAGRNFANKLWNATRFSYAYIEAQNDIEIKEDILYTNDKWILNKLSNIIEEVTNNIENHEIGIAFNLIYDFVWSDFCDAYIEMVKPRLYKDEESNSYKSAVSVLNYVLKNILKLLHPYMPFVTEELYMHLKHQDESIMISDWPKVQYKFGREQKVVEEILTLIRQIRNIKAKHNIANTKKINATFVSLPYDEYIKEIQDSIIKMAGLGQINVYRKIDEQNNMIVIHSENIQVFLDLDSVIDKQEEINKTTKDLQEAKSELKRATQMLQNEKFIANAPEVLIQKEKEKVVKYETLINKLEESLKKVDKRSD